MSLNPSILLEVVAHVHHFQLSGPSPTSPPYFAASLNPVAGSISPSAPPPNSTNSSTPHPHHISSTESKRYGSLTTITFSNPWLFLKRSTKFPTPSYSSSLHTLCIKVQPYHISEELTPNNPATLSTAFSTWLPLTFTISP
ncbi:hypothetical protein BC829DRAFT_491535 [Chytridium lagenaria]|nr:hypothetical protein BC829DRAFT_491535 [Chytridium lagenaria]